MTLNDNLCVRKHFIKTENDKPYCTLWNLKLSSFGSRNGEKRGRLDFFVTWNKEGESIGRMWVNTRYLAPDMSQIEKFYEAKP
jgi:hypothetical protein